MSKDLEKIENSPINPQKQENVPDSKKEEELTDENWKPKFFDIKYKKKKRTVSNKIVLTIALIILLFSLTIIGYTVFVGKPPTLDEVMQKYNFIDISRGLRGLK